MSERGTRWERQQAAESARTTHPDGTPRYWLIRSIRRAFREFGWPIHPSSPSQRRLEQRARALDAVADDPEAYNRLLWSDPLLAPEPDKDVVNGRGRRAQCCDAEHGCTGFLVDRRDRNQRIQAAYDSIRTGARRRARAMDTGAPAKPDFGCRASDLPYFRRAGGRATDAAGEDIFDLAAVERSTSPMFGHWVGR